MSLLMSCSLRITVVPVVESPQPLEANGMMFEKDGQVSQKVTPNAGFPASVTSG